MIRPYRNKNTAEAATIAHHAAPNDEPKPAKWYDKYAKAANVLAVMAASVGIFIGLHRLYNKRDYRNYLGGLGDGVEPMTFNAFYAEKTSPVIDAAFIGSEVGGAILGDADDVVSSAVTLTIFTLFDPTMWKNAAKFFTSPETPKQIAYLAGSIIPAGVFAFLGTRGREIGSPAASLAAKQETYAAKLHEQHQAITKELETTAPTHSQADRPSTAQMKPLPKWSETVKIENTAPIAYEATR